MPQIGTTHLDAADLVEILVTRRIKDSPKNLNRHQAEKIQDLQKALDSAQRVFERQRDLSAETMLEKNALAGKVLDLEARDRQKHEQIERLREHEASLKTTVLALEASTVDPANLSYWKRVAKARLETVLRLRNALARRK